MFLVVGEQSVSERLSEIVVPGISESHEYFSCVNVSGSRVTSSLCAGSIGFSVLGLTGRSIFLYSTS